MKKSALVLSIVSAILVIVAALLLCFTPNLLGSGSYIVLSDGSNIIGYFNSTIVAQFGNLSKQMFTAEFYKSNLVLYFLPVLLAIIVVLWLVHFILLICKKRPSALAPNLINLVFGLIAFSFFDLFLIPGYFGSGNVPALINDLGLSAGKLVLAYAPYIIALFAFALIVASFIISFIDVCENPGSLSYRRADRKLGVASEEPLYDANEAANSDESLRQTLNSEIRSSNAKETTTNGTQSSPTIVQYFYNNAPSDSKKENKEGEDLNKEEVRALIREEMGKGPHRPCGHEPFPPFDDGQLDPHTIRQIVAEEIAKANGTLVEEEEEPEVLNSRELRKIVAEEMAKANGQPIEEETVDDSDALTSDELRDIIAEEIAKANGKKEETAVTEEEDETPLTKDSIKNLIADEIKKALGDEEEIEIDGDDLLTSDELRNLIREELKSEDKEVASETLTSDDLRDLIRQELNGKSASDEDIDIQEVEDEEPIEEVAPETETPADEATVEETSESDVLTSDDLRSIIRDELKNGVDTNETLTSDELRDLIRDELKNGVDGNAEVLTSDDLRDLIRQELNGKSASDEDIDIQEVEDEEPAEEAAKIETSTEEATPETEVHAEETTSEKSSESDVLTSEDLRTIIREELHEELKTNSASDTVTEDAADEETVKEAATENDDAEDVQNTLTSEDLRSIIRDELKKDKENIAPEVILEEDDTEEEKPLTANDLRSLIQEALEEHDNPERRELTEDEARGLIVEQVRSYYEGKSEDAKADSDAVKTAKEAEAKAAEAEEKAKAEEEKRLALEKAIREDIEARKANNNEKISLDEIRAIVRSELENVKPVVTETAAPVVTEVTSKEDIQEIIRNELSSFRDEQAKAQAKAAQEAADAHLIEQARAEAEAEETKAQSEEIKNLKENAITQDDVRNIISEELDKRFAELIEAQKKAAESVVAKPIEEPKTDEAAPAPATTTHQTIVIQVAQPEAKKEEPVVVEEKKEVKKVGVAKESGDQNANKIIRIPFNERMAVADKDTIAHYNELKAECLSYGLKSRLSNSGDTFRLHTKTYVKITIAGKGLKLYLALDPKDYADNPIPLHDAGDKNIYKEIPGVFKVKSDLSLHRAKELIADACEKDGLEQGKIIKKNYADELKDYVPQLGGKKDED